MKNTEKYAKTTKLFTKLSCGLLFCCILPSSIWADTGTNDSLSALLEEGEAALSFRYRYESVDHENFAKHAQASTLRSRLTLKSGNYKMVNFLLEVDDVHVIGKNDYNEGAGNTPRRGQFPVVADPVGTEVNQLYVDINTSPKFRARLGRQRINLDNQRFIGGVGWRQNEQTYDAVSLQYKNESITGFYAYIDQVNRIFGRDVPAGKHEQSGTHLLNISGNISDVGKLAVYYYGIDNSDLPAFSTNTWGARFTGETKPNSETTISYSAEYALQSDAGKNPADYSASYWSLQGTVSRAGTKISLGWDVLGGDKNSPANEAFRTPLATLHAFNGWADVFLATPQAGLDDKYVKLQHNLGPWVFHARYHHFEAQDGSSNLGNEIDLRAGYKFSKKIRGDLFYADFSGKNSLADVRKFWLAVSLTL